MFHFTIFGASEARMPPRGLFCITICGATVLRRPTLAQRILNRELDPPQNTSWFKRVTDSSRNAALTLFGATEVELPTLMEEYSSLCSLIATHALDRSELAGQLRAIAAQDRAEDITTVTLFGAFEQTRPSAKKQLKALANGEKAGLIPPSHRQRLDEVADAPPATSIAALGDLVAEMA